MAVRLPMAIDSTARITSMPCQSATISPRPCTRMRITNTKAASFGAAPIISVIAVDEPW
ncbi:hypothetical protein D3C78_1917390 [compost metagenome]